MFAAKGGVNKVWKVCGYPRETQSSSLTQRGLPPQFPTHDSLCFMQKLTSSKPDEKIPLFDGRSAG